MESSRKRQRPRELTMPAAVAATASRTWLPQREAVRFPREKLSLPPGDGVAPAAALPTPLPEVLLLNRATFCYTGADLAYVRSLGVEAWIEEQLHPENIDDGIVESYIRNKYPSLSAALTPLLRRKNNWKTIYELWGATFQRSLFSKRHLFERMVEFWSDHFNIYVWDDFGPPMKIVDDREVIRRHALGKFRDLLRASMHSAAMITYLDNHTNTKEGPNENYARELLELHTMGADNGYTQTDVEEVARCLTGLGISWRKKDYGSLQYHPDEHDDGAKTVLGVVIPAGGGLGDVDRLSDILAVQPATAAHIAEKLCRRFVADQPPAALVDRVRQIYIASEGDIRAMLREIFNSEEFWNSADQKLKRPFEFVVSALTATGATYGKDRDESLGWYLYLMEQAPFEWQPPNGYPDVGAAWGNSNGILARWNFALWLAQGWLGGVKDVTEKLIKAAPGKSAAALVDYFSERFLQRALIHVDRERLIAFVAAGKGPDTPLDGDRLYQGAVGAIALLLNSPYFQYK